MTTILLAALGLLLLVFAALVAAAPKTAYQTSVRIEKPAEEVFRFLSDYANTSRWLDGLANVQPTGGTPGTVGSTARYTFVENGRSAVFDEEILAVEQGKSFEFRLTSTDLHLLIRTDLSPDGGATVVSMHNEVTPVSVVMRAMNPFVKGMMKKRQEADLGRLKKLLEG